MSEKKKIYEHNYTLPLILAVLALVFLLFLYFQTKPKPQTDDETTTTPETTQDEPMNEEKTPAVSFQSDLSAFEEAMTASDEAYLLLVNKQHPLGASYAPEQTVKVKDTHKDIELEKTAALALEAMFIEMRACGIRDVFVTSAYRTYAYQEWLFHYYIEDEMAKDPSLSREQAKKLVLVYSAAPGTSEHQSGLSVDLMTNTMRELDESFATYPVYDWLTENAWKFGFVLRFPKDKTDITGYQYEPWHYRFVGRDAAYQMWKDGLCLEEFLEQKQ